MADDIVDGGVLGRNGKPVDIAFIGHRLPSSQHIAEPTVDQLIDSDRVNVALGAICSLNCGRFWVACPHIS